MTAADGIKGECEKPEKLFDFMGNLIQGTDTMRRNCEDDFIKIKSPYAATISTL